MSFYIPPRGKQRLPLPDEIKGNRLARGKADRPGGPKLLLAFVILTAVEDYCRGDERTSESARQYLMNNTGIYGHHLQAVGRDPDHLPVGIPAVKLGG